MNRYMLFAYDQYYPSGGWNDFVGYFVEFEEAESKGKELINDRTKDYFDVVDSFTGCIVGYGS